MFNYDDYRCPIAECHCPTASTSEFFCPAVLYPFKSLTGILKSSRKQKSNSVMPWKSSSIKSQLIREKLQKFEHWHIEFINTIKIITIQVIQKRFITGSWQGLGRSEIVEEGKPICSLYLVFGFRRSSLFLWSNRSVSHSMLDSRFKLLLSDSEPFTSLRWSL